MTPKEFEKRCHMLRDIGCLACRQRGWVNNAIDIHHLNQGGHAGGARLGDEFTIALCIWHHRGIVEDSSPFCLDNIRQALGPSLKHEPNRFREVFGSDDTLLYMQNNLIYRRSNLNAAGI